MYQAILNVETKLSELTYEYELSYENYKNNPTNTNLDILLKQQLTLYTLNNLYMKLLKDYKNSIS